MRCAGGVAAALLLAGWAWLDAAGLPAPLARRIQRRFQDAGWDVRFRRLRLDFSGRLVADRARLYLDAADSLPVFEAERVRARLRIFSLRRAGRPLRSLAVRNATLRWPSAERLTPDTAAAAPTFPISSAELAFPRGGGIRIRRLRAAAAGIAWNIEGTIRPPAARTTVPSPAPNAATTRQWMRQIHGGWSGGFDRVGAAAPIPQFAGAPDANVRFDWYPDDPARGAVTGNLRAGAGRWSGLVFTGLVAEIGWHAGLLRVTNAALTRADGGIALNAEWRPGKDQMTLAARTTLPADALFAWRTTAAAPEPFWSLLPRGPTPPVIEWRSGPQPAADVVKNFSARFRMAETDWAGLSLASLAGEWTRAGDRWMFTNLTGRLRSGQHPGSFRGHLKLDEAAQTVAGALAGRCDPRALLSWLPADFVEYFGGLFFDGPPPEWECVFSDRFDQDYALRLEGRVQARQAVYNGAAMDALSARFDLADGVLSAQDIVLRRPEGDVRGEFTQDLRRGWVDFAGESEWAPRELARLIGPAAFRLARRLRLEAPCQIAARGRFDYRTLDGSDFTFAVTGRQIGVRWIVTDYARFDGAMRGRTIALDHLRADWLGGGLTGRILLELPPDDPPDAPIGYWAEGAATNLDFAALLAVARPDEPSGLSGRVRAEWTVAGSLGEGQGRTALGAGRIAVEQGHLFRVPVLGPLSRLLDRLSPGAGFATQSDLHADWVIRDGRVASDNVAMDGNLISARARGEYAFRDALRFTVQVKLLREGLLANVLRVVTWPITKLMEFEVRGPLGEPRWRPRNLPKELFLIFDAPEKSGASKPEDGHAADT